MDVRLFPPKSLKKIIAHLMAMASNEAELALDDEVLSTTERKGRGLLKADSYAQR